MTVPPMRLTISRPGLLCCAYCCSNLFRDVVLLPLKRAVVAPQRQHPCEPETPLIIAHHDRSSAASRVVAAAAYVPGGVGRVTLTRNNDYCRARLLAITILCGRVYNAS